MSGGTIVLELSGSQAIVRLTEVREHVRGRVQDSLKLAIPQEDRLWLRRSTWLVERGISRLDLWFLDVRGRYQVGVRLRKPRPSSDQPVQLELFD